MVKNATYTLQMEDPEHAAARGVSAVHFTSTYGPRTGDWTMLSRPPAIDSSSLPENDRSRLPKVFESHIEVRIVSSLQNVAPLMPSIAIHRRSV